MELIQNSYIALAGLTDTYDYMDRDAVAAWKHHFEDVGAVNVWDYNNTEWGTGHAQWYIAMPKGTATLLVKSLDVHLTIGLGEELSAVEDGVAVRFKEVSVLV